MLLAACRERTEDGEENGWFDCWKCSTVDFVISRLISVGLMSRDVTTFVAARKNEMNGWPPGYRVDQGLWCHDITGKQPYRILCS